MTLESKYLASKGPYSSLADLTSSIGLNKKLTDLFATQAECMNRDGYSRDMARCSPLQQQTRVCMRTVRLQQRRRKTEGIFIT